MPKWPSKLGYRTGVRKMHRKKIMIKMNQNFLPNSAAIVAKVNRHCYFVILKIDKALNFGINGKSVFGHPDTPIRLGTKVISFCF